MKELRYVLLGKVDRTSTAVNSVSRIEVEYDHPDHLHSAADECLQDLGGTVVAVRTAKSERASRSNIDKPVSATLRSPAGKLGRTPPFLSTALRVL